ncbi:hypothetical protein R1flu_002033 [Riccia fluitans]|uniref:Uncharacterized protein n=1 Tax=Riccia fluitans TaxID=41844 RepID=A0ABD1Y583_9MARC
MCPVRASGSGKLSVALSSQNRQDLVHCPQAREESQLEEFGGDRVSRNLTPSGDVSVQVFHVVGRFARLLSVYGLYHYLIGAKISVVVFMFGSLLGSTAVFFGIQKPWKGRPLTRSQITPTVINGAVLAFSLVLWGRGLQTCGPVRTILAEYVGAVLGAISTLLFGRGGHRVRKAGGLVAMLAAFYFLAQGWAMASYSPFYIPHRSDHQIYSFVATLTFVLPSDSTSATDDTMREKGHVGLHSMITPIFSGLLSALRRIIARRVSLKSQSKKRLHTITVASATCVLFPFALSTLAMSDAESRSDYHGSALWPYISMILFGIVLMYYVDAMIEDKLHIVPSSPQHLALSAGCIIVLEFIYRMDFSPLGFLFCLTWLGSGIYVATTVESKFREDFEQGERLDFMKENARYRFTRNFFEGRLKSAITSVAHKSPLLYSLLDGDLCDRCVHSSDLVKSFIERENDQYHHLCLGDIILRGWSALIR